MENTKSKQEIFRKKSIEQLSAPEQLTGYLRVTGPGVWLALAGIVILLAGLLVWGIFGTIISTVTVPSIVKDKKISCYVLEEDIDLNDPEIEINIGDVTLYSEASGNEKQTLDASDDPRLYSSGYLSPGKNAVILTGSTDLKDGYYDAVVTTNTLKPISLLLANN